MEDTTGNGTISRDEAISQGLNEQLFNELDANNDNQLDPHEADLGLANVQAVSPEENLEVSSAPPFASLPLSSQVKKNDESWNKAKNLIQGNKENVIGAATTDGIQTDDFNPEVSNPKMDADEGDTLKMFRAKLNGESEETEEDIDTEKQVMQNKISKTVQTNYQRWSKDDDGFFKKEKGRVRIRTDGGEILVKFGSKRETSLENFIANNDGDNIQTVYLAIK